MIAFVLISISCFPATGDLLRDVWAIGPWTTAPVQTRRRILRDAGLIALCWVALIELWFRFAVGF